MFLIFLYFKLYFNFFCKFYFEYHRGSYTVMWYFIFYRKIPNCTKGKINITLQPFFEQYSNYAKCLGDVKNTLS